MVAFAAVQEIDADAYAQNSSGGSQPGNKRLAQSSPSRRRTEAPWTPTSEHPLRPSQFEVIPGLLSPPLTGAQIPTASQELAGTQLELAFISRRAAGHASLADLPRPKRIVTTFEPHLRQATVRNLQARFALFAQSIGQPVAAVAKAELIAELSEAYRTAISSPGTRTFASAISLLQDFLRPHWSEISAAKLEAVNERLGFLGGRTEMNVPVVERFYRDMVAVMGTGISADVVGDDEEESPDSE